MFGAGRGLHSGILLSVPRIGGTVKPVLDARLRGRLQKVLGPLGRALHSWGIRADHLTAFGVAAALADACVIGSGHLAWGFVLLLVSAVPDLLDGAVARSESSPSSRGAFFDSVADRVSDSAVLGGIAWYLAGRPHPRLAILALSAMAIGLVISYERAKAEALGYSAKVGLMERGERIVCIAVGLALPWLLVPVLWLLVALGSITVAQRFRSVWVQASKADGRAVWRAARVESRWRLWREQVRLQRAARASGGTRSWSWGSRRAGGVPARRRARRSAGSNGARWSLRRDRVRVAKASGRPLGGLD